MSVVLKPLQILAGEALNETVGGGVTVTVTLPVFEHELASVPVTLYVIVAVGLTVCVAVAMLLLQVYDVPPPAVNVEGTPEHTDVGLADAVIVGKVLTVNATEPVP